jgi:hypothetical protein
MFAGKHRDPSGGLEQAADAAFSILFELIRQGQEEGILEPGEPDRVGLVLFATVQGIAALITGGMIEPDQLDGLVAEAIARFLRGSRAAASAS